MILAGDIGGTNTRLAIFDDRLTLVRPPSKFPTGNGSRLEEYVKKVLKSAKGEKITRACLAIAGPVIDGVCNSTNIGRAFVAEDIRKAAGLESLILINDLVANAAGIATLGKSDIHTLIKGEKHHGNCAIVSPGTGLGEGALIWDGRRHRPIPSEGGHSRFGPTTDLESDFYRYLAKRISTVTYEDVCSGKGIEPLFRFFVERGESVSPAFMRKFEKLESKKRGAAISEAALDKSQPAAVAAMNLFVRTLGIEASNMVFKVFATGGVYLGGGIPPKILPLLKTRIFKDAFLTHRVEPIRELLTQVPVRVILNDDTALEGAASYGSTFDA